MRSLENTLEPKQIHLSEILFEFVVQGNFVKVMAVDPQSGIEVAMVGDARCPKTTLERLATQKLKMAIHKKYMREDISDQRDNLY